MNGCPRNCMCPWCMPCSCPMCHGAAQVAAQAGNGPVAMQFMSNVQAARMGYYGRPPASYTPASYNELAQARQYRYQLVHSDDLPGYDGIPTDLAAAMSYMVWRYAEVTGRARAALYEEAIRLRLITGSSPASFAPGGSPAGQVSQGLMQVLPPSPGGYPVPPWQASWQASAPYPGPPAGVTPGIDGFSGAGALSVTEPAPDADLEVPDSFEPVRGYRWWSMDPAPTSQPPWNADVIWPATPLRGARDAWAAGENIAKCKAGSIPDSVHPASQIPLEPCGCGFWAYWQLQHYDLNSATYPVCGVVEGYGQVIIGEKGFRSSKARIIALALPFTLVPVSYARRAQGSAWDRAGFRGSVYYSGMADPDRYRAVNEFEASQAERRDREEAEAWMGIISDRLSQMHPGARVFDTVATLLAKFPPDKSYGPEEQLCPNCGARTPDLYGHLASACGAQGLLR